MIKKVNKIRYNFGTKDIDAEEKWLNEMAASGWALKKKGKFFGYEFEKCEPCEYVIRIHWFEKMSSTVQDEKYMNFLRSTGVEPIGRNGEFLYTRKRHDPDFVLFTENDWKIRYYAKSFRTYLPSSIIFSLLTQMWLIDTISEVEKKEYFSAVLMLICAIMTLSYTIIATGSFIKAAMAKSRCAIEEKKNNGIRK